MVSNRNTDYLINTSPDQTKVDSWISSGFVDVPTEPSKVSIKTETDWPTVPDFYSQRSSVSSSDSSSVRPNDLGHTVDLSSRFPRAPPDIDPQAGESGQPTITTAFTSTSIESIELMLRRLMSDTNYRKKQMDMLFEKLTCTQNQLEQLASTQSELMKRLNTLQEQQEISNLSLPSRVSSCQGYMSESEAYETARPKPVHKASGLMSPSLRHHQNSASSTDGNSIPDWGQQILLQLRSQQGDFARRCSHLEGMLNKVNAMTNDLNQSYRRQQSKVVSPTAMDTRLDHLPKSTCDLIRPVVRAEMQNAFVNNTSRLVEPIQKAITVAIQDCLKSLPTALADNVNRLLREKNFTTQFARSTSAALSADLAGAYRDSLQRIFVPALDRNINRLLEELNAVFRTGTLHYLQEIEQRTKSTLDANALASSVASRIIPEIQGLMHSESGVTLTGSSSINTLESSVASTKPHMPAGQSKSTADNTNNNVHSKKPKTVTAQSSSDVSQSKLGFTPSPNPSAPAKLKVEQARQAQKLIQQDMLVEALELVSDSYSKVFA
ncbi:unnamed protein product [Echinostoma caproni]|uniref:Enhancer of mRNA-decapping protein 4 n=1 Tax=Echinostoma caproni TaxID=27848 RepID=A0A183APT4_9TREM|nr:unnamed protein product [Echinostoma caproni]